MSSFLLDKNLTNYWGYNTLSFFAFEPAYASAADPHAALREFKGMVKRLHAAGIEVILDVAYNHTAEGNQLGPTLTFRGLDNASYYRLSQPAPRYYEDFTGCGNTMSMRHPAGLRLLMDSLRYWVTEMHVDGFRFDLASALARELQGWDKLGSFFDAIGQDPVLTNVKLIAEPWDVGMGGYQVGNYPTGWAEWNGRYRDEVRRFWKGAGAAGELAARLSGSADLYDHSGRHPHASINFITCHDGFCLRDLVSYNDKHNFANGDDNRDGDNHNNSWNCGEEGESANPAIQALRYRQARNFLATLFFSQGVPMLLAGDDRWHTQQGNNNCYCQDNVLSWLEWSWSDYRGQTPRFHPRVDRAPCRISRALPQKLPHRQTPRPGSSQGCALVERRRPRNDPGRLGLRLHLFRHAAYWRRAERKRRTGPSKKKRQRLPSLQRSS